MLKPIEHIVKNPEDIPSIDPVAAQYLKARLNMAYLSISGVLNDLRREGFSESAILGFLEGANAAVEVVELMEQTNEERFEDQQITM